MTAADRYDSLFRWAWAETSARSRFAEGLEAVDWRILKAIAKQESGFNQRAVNKGSGAAGLMQLMPDLWKPLDADPFNPETNITIGAHVLLDKWAIFKAEQGLERWRFALGAYNGGQGDIVRAQAVLATKKRPTDQWHEIVGVLPHFKSAENARQNVEYVRLVMSDFLAWRAAAPAA